MAEILTPQQLKELMGKSEDMLIIDTLPKGMFRKQHIPGAISIPVDDVAEIVPKIADTQQKIVVYCYDTDCQASPKSAKILEELGFTNVSDLEVGIEGWKQAGFDIATFSS